MHPILLIIQNNIFYIGALYFLAAYPIFTAISWTSASLIYWMRREYKGTCLEMGYFPLVSVVIPVHNEEQYIEKTLEQASHIDYPNYEIIVVDDCSTDKSPEIIQKFTSDKKVRILTKTVNEGKAMALNDALPCSNGEILMFIDADAVPDPNLLKYTIPHFSRPRVAAVTGNPRVKNVTTFLSRLQLIEFTSIITLLRRAQRVWGRITTVSGVVVALRKQALVEAGGFDPTMETEDIDLTWSLQRLFWDIIYESRALVWMNVPTNYMSFFKQRLRWARGLIQVLRKNYPIFYSWKYRRLWPIYIESTLSVLWAICFVTLTCFWMFTSAFGLLRLGANPVPLVWGMTTATFALIMTAVGTLIDSKYDRKVLLYYPYAIYYPIFYWILLAIIAVMGLPALFDKIKGPVVWTR